MTALGQKRTSVERVGMSALCQKRTSTEPLDQVCWCVSTQQSESHCDKTGDNSSDGIQEGPSDIVVGLLLLEPLRFRFITKTPPLSLQFISEAIAAGRALAAG
jgi:hypothetical protein